jgi:hypothetical protein
MKIGTRNNSKLSINYGHLWKKTYGYSRINFKLNKIEEIIIERICYTKLLTFTSSKVGVEVDNVGAIIRATRRAEFLYEARLHQGI